MPAPPTLDDLRRYAVARTLFKPTTLGRAIEKLGFVQADPIRAPARAQDLTLRHRVIGYHAGDLERRYGTLQIEEDALVNYGFLPRRHLAWMHPRTARKAWDEATTRRADEVLAFIREHGPTHPRTVDAHFAHGRLANHWGGAGNASTQLLDAMHYRGLLRVKRRDSGTRVYEAVAHAAPELDADTRARHAGALVDLIVRKYAPLPSASLGYLVSLLGYGAPQLRVETRQALKQMTADGSSHHPPLQRTRIDATTWLWPADENPRSSRWAPDDRVRLLAPFDPVVWDRRRFELLWGWRYRFEAYLPAPQRKLGYYALPMLWGDRIPGWANASVHGGALKVTLGFVDKPVRDAVFKRHLAEEQTRMAEFLGL